MLVYAHCGKPKLPLQMDKVTTFRGGNRPALPEYVKVGKQWLKPICSRESTTNTADIVVVRLGDGLNKQTNKQNSVLPLTLLISIY